MAQRVAVLEILNKRNGIVQNVTLRPGQSVRWKDVIVRLRACETTAPWEEEKLTGAFVQLDVQKPDKSWNRVFSGWLYKESPSLNVVEHPVYDVWPELRDDISRGPVGARRARQLEQPVERAGNRQALRPPLRPSPSRRTRGRGRAVTAPSRR